MRTAVAFLSTRFEARAVPGSAAAAQSARAPVPILKKRRRHMAGPPSHSSVRVRVYKENGRVGRGDTRAARRFRGSVGRPSVIYRPSDGLHAGEPRKIRGWRALGISVMK